ncbi:MAG: c-type cytochrome [Opitutales bacterium]
MSDEKKTTGPDPSSKASLEKAGMQDERMQDVHAQLMREKEEPHEGFSPIPIVLIFLFAALCFWAGVYLVEHSGDFRWDAYDPDFVAGEGQPEVAEVSLVELGAKVYRNNCAQCHQADGKGVSGVYPPLDGADWVTGHPEVLARILINGLNGPIEVAGKTYNGNMPAFGPSGSNLKPRQIAGVLTYIRQEWGNDASEITESMMEDYMDQYEGRSAQWTADELKEDLSPEPEPESEEAEESEESDDSEESGESEESEESEESGESKDTEESEDEADESSATA